MSALPGKTEVTTDPGSDVPPDNGITVILAGARGAEEAFYREHAGYVARVLGALAIRRPVPATIDARELDELIVDAATDAIAWGIRNAAKHDPNRGKVGTWLVQKAWSLFYRQALVASRRICASSLDGAELVADPSPGPEHHLAVQERLREVERLLRTLPGKQGGALLLADYYQYGMHEIATMLTLSSSEAASSLVRRARARFEREWRKSSEAQQE